jgi:hypothetical protein
MAAGVKIEGFKRVTSVLGGLAVKARREGARSRYAVGFQAPYAVYVHENLQAHHSVGQAKFLEQPMRENRAKYRALIRQLMKRRFTIDQAMLGAARALLRDALPLVPVDTGRLKKSGKVWTE